MEPNGGLTINFGNYHDGSGSDIRSTEEDEDNLLLNEIRPGGLEDNLITDKLPMCLCPPIIFWFNSSQTNFLPSKIHQDFFMDTLTQFQDYFK